MKNVILLSILALFQYSFVYAQIWGASTQSDFTNEATAMAFDASNNLYVTGYITGESAFNANVTFSSAQGNGDIYVAKYNPSGSLVWVKKFGGSMSDRAYDIKVDNSGDIVVSGQYFGTVNFGGQTLQSVANSKDIFVIKMNPQGDVLWAISEGGALGDNMYALAIDQQNNIILTGQFAGSMDIAGQTFNSVVNPDLNQPSYDIFVSKYNSSGTPIWALHGAAKYEDRGMALGTDTQNNIYLAGQFSDTLNFAGQTYNNNGYNVGFLTKLNPNGQIQWFNRMTAGMVLPYDLVVGGDNQISVCGDFLGNLMHHGSNGVQTLTHDFARKVFVSTVNSSGQVQWQRALGSDSEISARGIARDANNQIYVTGHFRCALTELQQNSTALFNSVGFRDIYLWALNAQGTALQTKQMGGRKNDYAYDIQLNSLGQPFICGSFMNSLFVPHSNLATTNSPNNSFNFGSINPFYFLQGDESPNSFVSGALHQSTYNYNYFNGQPADSLFGYISQSDTLYFCDQGELAYNPLTHIDAGPGYNYLWNTSDTTQYISVNQSGEYSVYVERWDGCVDNNDTIQVVINITPQMPLLSDDIIQNTNEPLSLCTGFNSISTSIHLCAPDSALVWFTPIDPGLTFTVTGPQTNITDTDPHMYSEQGVYTAVISSPFCSQTKCFRVVHDAILEKDIDPKPLFVDSNIVNDTLVICFGEWSHIRVIDLLTNPQLDTFLLPTTPVVYENFNVTNNGSPVPVSQDPEFYRAYYQPLTTGWHVLNYSLITGYSNTCGLDTLHSYRTDSIYVIVNPLPSASTQLNMSSLLCPNGSIFLTTSNVFPGFTWSGPSIDWVSPNTDSVQVSMSGSYGYSGTITDPITGCSKDFIFPIFVPEKVPPAVVMSPQDAIVCPYDSVLMMVPNIYVGYSWTGPSGTDLSLTNTHLDAEMGFYYCTVLDNEGCYLTTPPVEIQEYATPYIFVEPSNVLCFGQQVQISAVFTGMGSVNWLPPLSGSASIQNISAPGWYGAELTSCGITVVDSILILDGSFTPVITASDTLLCFGENVVISTNIPNAYYTWSNGMEGVNSIQVTEAGTYSASVMNDAGCTAQTNQITVTFVEGSTPPNSYTITLCEPGQETLTTNQNILAIWFDANMNPLDTALTYLQFFNNSTTLFAAYPQENCPVTYATIQVNVIEPIAPYFEITGDTLLCHNGVAEYSTNWSGDISWYLNGTLLANTPNITLIASNLLDTNTLIAIISNSCHSLTLQTEILVQAQQQLIPSFFDTIVCPNSQVSLNFDGIENEIFTVNNVFTGSNGSILLNIENNAISYQFYSSDNLGCSTDTVTVNFDIYVSNFQIVEIYTPVCTPDTLILTTNSAAMVDWQINLFNSSADTLSYPIIDAGVYLIHATHTDSLGCFHSAESSITVFNPNALLLPDTMVCIGETIYTAYQFSYDNGPIYTPLDSIQIMNSQTVNYLVYNNFGCPFAGEIQIEAINCSVDFPNVITPNGDGVNEYFEIKTALMEGNNQLIISNRWGNVVFEENGYRNTFNGANCSDGVYFYQYTRNRLEPSSEIIKGFLHITRGQ